LEVLRRRSVEKGRFNIRLDEDAAHFYRSQARAHKMSVPELLRQMLVQGVIAETVHEIETCLKYTVADIRASTHQASLTVMPESARLSLFTSEALLTTIVESRNPQQLYEAQNIARAKLKRISDAVAGLHRLFKSGDAPPLDACPF
jgi:hypothetical protein